jgi:Lipopolysaccharide-assembly
MFRAWYLLFIFMSLSGCYTFKGISIDPNIATYFVRNFENLAANAPPTLAVTFTERLKDKIRLETRLQLQTEQPDIEFSGKIVDFRVIPVAPKPGETVSLNRLEVQIRVNLTNNKDETKNWSSERDFSFFREFGIDQELLSIQDRLTKEINDQLLEDVFNAAFNDW